jgi:hypothetical protein
MANSEFANLFLTEPRLRSPTKVPGMNAPGAVVECKTHFGTDTNFTMAWRYVTQPMIMDKISHAHPEFDQFLCFFGADLTDMFNFDADIELTLGKDREIYPINQATVVYIPRGLVHCPINFKRVGKPILFHPISMTSAYYTRGEASKVRQEKN